MLGQRTGIFQGHYKWDTVKDAENYWKSFPMKLMKKRAVPSSLTYSISEISNQDQRGENLLVITSYSIHYTKLYDPGQGVPQRSCGEIFFNIPYLDM